MKIFLKQNQAIIKLIHNIGSLYWLKYQNLSALSIADYNLLLAKFNHEVSTKNIEILSTDSKAKKEINAFLNHSVLNLAYQKITVKRDLEEFEFVDDKIFSFLSIAEFSKNTVFNLFTEIIQGDADMSLDARQEFNDLININSSESYKQDWKIVVHKKELIGVVLPYRYLDNLNEATLLYIGLKPEFRNRGFAKEIHRKALLLLKQMGAKTYFGSTLKTNIPMLKTFQHNDCKIDSIQLFYK